MLIPSTPGAQQALGPDLPEGGLFNVRAPGNVEAVVRCVLRLAVTFDLTGLWGFPVRADLRPAAPVTSAI